MEAAVAEIDKLCEALSGRVFPNGNVCLPPYSKLLANTEQSRIAEITSKYAEDPLMMTQSASKVVAVLQKLPKHQRVAYMLKLYVRCTNRIKELQMRQQVHGGQREQPPAARARINEQEER